VQRVALRHVSTVTRSATLSLVVTAGTRTRSAAAGACAAVVWAALEPLDRRLLDNDYSDVALLGKAVTRTRAWPVVGLAIHAANGAVFGIAYHELRRRRRVTAVRLALSEHLALFPLGVLVDRHHPARGQAGVERVFGARAFVQATWRHLLFGAVLGRLADA
jgi:hypothetical protein